MKKLLKQVILVFFKSIYFIIDYQKVNKLKFYYEKCYSIWLGHYFKDCSTAFFRRPIYIIGGKYISLGANFTCESRCRIEAWDKHNGVVFLPSICIGNNVSLSYNCHIGAINKIIIQDNVLIGSNVFITDHSHGDASKEELKISPNKRILFSKGPVIIEENVWIGENVTILPGVTIGKNSIIGANTLVIKSIPANCVAVGNPARIVKHFN
jgi:acetyltransferase-like isoleucine patch superfamily enzyme